MDSRNKIDQMTKIKLLSIHNYDSRSSFDTVTQVICLFTFTRGQSPRDSEKNKSHHVVSRGEKSLYWDYMSSFTDITSTFVRNGLAFTMLFWNNSNLHFFGFIMLGLVFWQLTKSLCAVLNSMSDTG